MSKYPTRYQSVLRVGNPWLVGHNVNRIVPVHALQSFLATVYDDGESVQNMRDLARGEPPIERMECFKGWKPRAEEAVLLQESMFAVLAPDRRLFRTRGGARPATGSVTPLISGMTADTPSDDGLGRRMGQLLTECLEDDWKDRLDQLFLPRDRVDPVTSLVTALANGHASGIRKEVAIQTASVSRNELERSVASFVDALIRDLPDARRLMAIQEFGRGVYFGAILLMAASPLWNVQNGPPKKQDRRLVFVYAGMPPGNQHDPLVLAAARSFQRFVEIGWNVTAEEMQRRISRQRAPSTMRPKDQWEHRLREAIVQGLPDRDKRYAERIVEYLGPPQPKQSTPTISWCREVLEEKLGLGTHALSQRLRSLGANIGFSGPDRGRGLPRFYCETPLLGTLVSGVCEGGSMRFETFVSKLRERFGLVFGPGDDEDTWERLGAIWGGSEGEELLKQNEDELRMRLIRAGLARTFSDSHTEVTPRG